MNRRNTWVSYAVGALAILAAVASVPTAAATPPSKSRCCRVEDNGAVECAQLRQGFCGTTPGASDIAPGSCKGNPPTSPTTTTTGPATTTTTQPTTTTTSTTTTSPTTTTTSSTTTTTTSSTTTTSPITTTTTTSTTT